MLAGYAVWKIHGSRLTPETADRKNPVPWAGQASGLASSIENLNRTRDGTGLSSD